MEDGGWRMEDVMEGQSDEGCWMWDTEHRLDAEASWSLKGYRKQWNK